MSHNFLIRTIGAQADITHVLIPEALDTLTAYHLQERMQMLFKNGLFKYIINLEDVRYISSTGIQILFLLQQELDNYDGKMVLTNVSEKISLLFEAIGVMPLLGITENVEQAMEKLDTNEQ